MSGESIYTQLDLSKIQSYVANGQEENLHLDFKLSPNSELDRDGRRTFAKALSGYSNSDGGVIVWGVDARPNADGIDCATNLVPINNLTRFMSSLTQFTPEVVNPLVDGVTHKRIDDEQGQDSGYAATLIPASDSGPHMAKATLDRYFKRSGSSFRKMEHFDLEDMFGRRKKPSLGLRCRIQYEALISKGTHKVHRSRIILSLENSGRAIAKFPFISLHLSDPYKIYGYGLEGNGVHGLGRLPKTIGSDWNSFGGQNEAVIYPGLEHDVTVIRYDYPSEASEINELRIDYRITAENMLLIEDSITISSDELLSGSTPIE